MAKRTKPVSAQSLRPYLAPVLLSAAGKARHGALLAVMVAEVEASIQSTSRVTRTILESVDLGSQSSLRLHAIVYREAVTPAWHVGAAFTDIAHQLVVLAVRKDYGVVCASEASLRDRIIKHMTAAKTLSQKRLGAFVGPEAAAIWLDGLHTPSAVKPNTKFMTGLSLEYALDPLGDQTYRYSAIRSRPVIAGLTDARGKSLPVGAAPMSSRIWVGRPRGWIQFTDNLRAILDHVDKRPVVSRLYDILATPVGSPAGVSDAYAVAVVPPELLAEDGIAAEDQEEARKWAYEARFEVKSTKGANVEVEASLSGQLLGRLALDMHAQADDAPAKVTATWVRRPKGPADEQATCERMLTDTNKLKIYYDSGHTLAQGYFFNPAFIDHFFPWEFLPMPATLVDAEKPTDTAGKFQVAAIGKPEDKSLFGWVVKRLFPNGWLASDDGSMEVADFIHVDPASQVLTLVHVKGSGSSKDDRTGSVSDYEIVVSQAIKNLRHLHMRSLHEVLTRGKGKQIGTAVWRDGKRQPDRTGFLAAVAKLPSSYQKVIVILQPRLTKREHDACKADAVPQARAMRMKQLNTLLLGARLSAMACGAEIRAIGQEV